MADLTAGQSKLVQYLNEAYGKEKELETALVAHIGMTTRAAYRKRLEEHLSETKRHARDVERRVKQIGGTPQAVPIEGFDALAKGAGAAVELAGRAAAAAQGPLHALRGTSEQEKMLKNAKSEYSDEHEEIATYSAIEILAEALGDTQTARLAREIRREEERMASFLARQLEALTMSVVQAEVPAAERRTRRRSSSRRSTAKRTSRTGARRATSRSSSSKTTKAKATKAKATKAKAGKAKTTRRKPAKAKAARARSSSSSSASRGTKTSSRGKAKRASSRSSSGPRAKR